MIVVVGAPAWREADPAGPAGRTCAVAAAAAARGSQVELVGRIGDDRTGDALLIALARAGVGHAAVLRDPVAPTPVVRPGAEPGERPLDEDPRAEAAPESRSDGPRLEPADVGLGLSYLTAFNVLVVADDAPAGMLPACVEGAAYAGASMVVLVPAGEAATATVPEGATLLEAPEGADDGMFAGLVGAFAAALDQGSGAEEAFRAATASAGWSASAEDEPA